MPEAIWSAVLKSTVSRRIAEEYSPRGLDHLLHPHTLARSFYMRPKPHPASADKPPYTSNEAFWADALAERIGGERWVTLQNFNVFDWVPRNPGLFHTREAEWARE